MSKKFPHNLLEKANVKLPESHIFSDSELTDRIVNIVNKELTAKERRVLILKYTGMPISTAFLLVLVILVLELSIASPGTTGGWTILFAALGLPVDYVGLFVTYRLACANYNAAYGALQVGLEQIEAASKFDAIDLDVLRDAHIEQAAP